jgi:hypothetical protein
VLDLLLGGRIDHVGINKTTVRRAAPGHPHGFMNFGFPAASDAFEKAGRWAVAGFSP